MITSDTIESAATTRDSELERAQPAVTIPELLCRAAKQYDQRVAIQEDGLRLTYAALNVQRVEVAKALLGLGVEPGDRVAVWAPNLSEWILTTLATQSIGAVLVPINTRMKGLEVAATLADSGARVLFCIDHFLGETYPELLAPHKPASLEHVVVLRPRAERPTVDGELLWADFLALAGKVDDAQFRACEQRVTGETVMDIMFTSGTTGRPKGVMTSQSQNLRAVDGWAYITGLETGDRYLIVNPFFHTFGYKAGWLAALTRGATILPHLVFDADAVMTRIENERVTVLPGPPTLYQSLLNSPRLREFDLSSLRMAVTGASAIPPVLIERMRTELGLRDIHTGYGLTESCGFATLTRTGDSAETVALTSGCAMPGVELRCVDAQGQPVPPDEPGEVLVRGYNVMRSYFNQADATAATIDADGWLHTGDIGVLDSRGYLRITDRIKDMFIVGGFNCYPAEIEKLLASHPAIAQCAVVGMPHDRLGEVGKAYVVLRHGARLTADDLIGWARRCMSNYKVPREIAFVQTLPISASGKILKYRLRES
ncbi:FadD3 family acyl-CoA ligase [Ralstonia insidiosa]|uniref:Fatty acid--CoA ligase n=1 Tax=Ralstonia insidiosa TaxID=190721 RepID=A0A192A3B2_9RALS|nr:FadD3 family acyl-CoA ligase [Ralstonia insidiosa]ANJ74960.1 fatty acid--CoA ligase [Ralstonia insidiosa]KAB0468321.1 fatty acid--CoA ligase family protein [Ralstonia insidiosa]MBY4911023.1 FadD3 family acyl-CoA ligase [Ralstonia insidiosa]